MRIVYRMSSIERLKPETYFMYHQLLRLEIVCSANIAFMFFYCCTVHFDNTEIFITNKCTP